MDGHTIYCVSNASTDFYKNTLTDFTNFLPKNITVDFRKWEIGVVAFGLELNIEPDVKTDVIQVKSNITTFNPIGDSSILYSTGLPASKKNNYFYHIIERVRYYPLRNTRLETINVEIIDAAKKRLALKAGQPSIVQFSLRKRRRNMPFRITHFQIDSKMDEVMNPQRKANNNFEVHLKKPLYLNQGAKIALTDISFPNKVSKTPEQGENPEPGVMVCYTNFITHSPIGDQFYPVLKMIPLHNAPDEDNYASIHFENLEFIKCNTTRLSILHFQFRRLDGELIDFNDDGRIVMNLAIKNPK